MTVPTQPVTVNLADFGGPSIAGVVVKARLSDIDYTSTGVFVSTEVVMATTDASGVATLNVFPCATAPSGLGTRGTYVLFTASIPQSKNLWVKALVPDTPSNLVNILIEDSETTALIGYVPPAQVSTYAALRSYVGNRTAIYVTDAGIAGLFIRDDSDTTSADNGGTIIVTTGGKRYKRGHDGNINIAWFEADGVGDDTTPIQNAINYVKSFSATQNELNLIWPGKTYRVTSLNLVGAERVTNVANGSVVILGTSVGGTSVINIDGGAGVTYTRQLNWVGNFSIQVDAGASYQYGVRTRSLIDSRWKLTVSGAFSINTMYFDYSWDNVFDLYASNSSGAAIATVKFDTNSCNRNNIFVRGTASGNMAVASTVLEVSGNANEVAGDFSAGQTGIKLVAARGTKIRAPYMEAVKFGVGTSGNPQATTIVGGLIEVGQDGEAFSLGSSENTTVIGTRIFGRAGSTNRTAFGLGAACYGLTVQQCNTDPATIDNAYTGTWRGHGGFLDFFEVLAAQWIGFPPTAIPSTDPNTLDDYREETPLASACTGAITPSVAWKAVKTGRGVVLTLPATVGTASAAPSFTYGTALPVDYRPTADLVFTIPIRDNGANLVTPGMVRITAAGVITVYKDGTGTANFTAAAEAGIGHQVGASLQWMV